jgi:hypothetical protein
MSMKKLKKGNRKMSQEIYPEKPRLWRNLEELGWQFNEAAEPGKQWHKNKGPIVVLEGSTEWAADVASAQVRSAKQQCDALRAAYKRG